MNARPAGWTPGSVGAAVGLCALAFVLRVPGLPANLPDLYWHDELNFVEGAMRVGAGEIVAASYGGYSHGTLTYYLLFAVYGAFFAVGRIVGMFGNSDDFLMAYVTDPSALLLVTRGVMLAASVATVALTFTLARRLLGTRVAILSAGLIAVSFQSVQLALGKEDGLFALLILVAVWLAIRITEQPAARGRFVLLGAALGAATAVKYFGVLALPLILVTAGVTAAAKDRAQRRTSVLRDSAVASAVYALVFFTLVPGVLLDTRRFILSFEALATINSATQFSYTGVAASPWYGYLWSSLALMNGPLLAALFYLGAVWMLRQRLAQGAVLLVYPAILFAALTATMVFGNSAEAVNFYQLSALPSLCICAGGLLDYLWRARGTAVRLGVAAVLAAIAATNLADDVRFQRLLALADSRTIARQWIEQNVPAGSPILVEGAVKTFVLEGPQLQETAASLQRDLATILEQGGGGRLWSAKLRAASLPGGPARFDVHKVYDLTPESLEAQPAYVVVRSVRGRQLLDADGRYRAIHAIEPDSPNAFRFVPLFSSVDIARLRRVPLLADDARLIPGPRLDIYRHTGVAATIGGAVQ